jgi:hypothetical protein
MQEAGVTQLLDPRVDERAAEKEPQRQQGRRRLELGKWPSTSDRAEDRNSR